MSVRYSVRRASPQEERAALLRLWSDSLPLREDAATKFEWVYAQAPIPPRDVFLLSAERAASAEEAGEATVVGTVGACPRQFQVGTELLRAAVLGDFAVDAKHRTLMPATLLMRAVRTDSSARYGLTYGFPNDRAIAVCRRVGFRELGKMSRYVRVLRHERFVRQVVKVPLVPPLAGRLLDLGRLALAAPAQLRARRSYRLAWLDRADARFDALWERARGEYPIVGARTAEFVQWRLLEQPLHRRRLAALVSAADPTRLHAYAAVRTNEGVARIGDLFGHKDALGPLLDSLLPALWREGATTAEIGYFGSRDVEATLRRRGFSLRNATRALIYDVGSALADRDALVREAANWHLTDADEDT